MNDIHIDRAALYEPTSPQTLADPFPVFRRLQRETPVFWHDGLFAWVLSRYHDCRRVLDHPDQFTRDRRKLGRHDPDDGMTIQSIDPPEQTPLRQAILHAIWRADMAGASEQACRGFERCLAGQAEDRPFDFMSEVAAPVAIIFACALVGLPHMAAASYHAIFLRLTRAMDREHYGQYHAAGVAATLELNAMIDAARATAPPGSMIHELDTALDATETHPAWVRNTISAAFNAAFSTAYSSMGSFLALCLERRGLAGRIVAGPSVALGVKELLRFTSPAQMTSRTALCDLVIGGVEVRRNDPVLTLLAAANRDPAVFAHPDELVLDRAPNPQLSFGHGPHRCVGTKPAEDFLCHYIAHLAGWEERLAAAAPPTWLDTATLRCLATLPVVLRRQPHANGAGAPRVEA